MPDRENAIKELHDIGGFIAGRIGIEQARNFLRTIDDAIEFLKEQEAVEPTWTCGKPFCGACGFWIPGGKFCSNCGKAVKWK